MLLFLVHSEVLILAPTHSTARTYDGTGMTGEVNYRMG